MSTNIALSPQRAITPLFSSRRVSFASTWCLNLAQLFCATLYFLRTQFSWKFKSDYMIPPDFLRLSCFYFLFFLFYNFSRRLRAVD